MTLRREIRSRWKPRQKDSHKGDYGRVFILAGSRDFSGAAYLAGLACLRMGAGLVTIGAPDSIQTILARRQPELMVKALPSTKEGSLSLKSLKPVLSFLKTQDVLAIGPGLSRNPETQKLVREILSKTDCPAVVDADGLNAFAGHSRSFAVFHRRAILTPHPGEFLKLFGGKIKTEMNRKKRALEAARITKSVVVLKGSFTVVAEPGGKIYKNTTGNPGMATGGTGDVLTGMIAALLGQGFSYWDSARFGVYIHGLAGDLAARDKGEISLIAGDLLDFLPQAIRKSITR